MNKTLIIFGYGSGISHAVAQRFGREGYVLALVARRAGRLAEAVKALQTAGIRAQAFAADLADAEAARQVVREVRAQMGGITVLHWNAFADVEGNLLDAAPATLQASLNIRLVSYLAAVQEALPDLQATGGAVLATSGITAYDEPHINGFAQELGVLAVSVAASLIGDSVWFYAGRRYGNRTLQSLCRLSLSRDTCMKRTERFYGRFGIRVLSVAKFIPGLSMVSVPLAGAMQARLPLFLRYDGLGYFVCASFWV